MRYKWLLKIFILITSSALLLAAAVVVVQIKEWEVPTPNSLPHDPGKSVV